MRTPPYGTIIERDRRNENQKLRDDRDRLSRQLRQYQTKYERAFDDGFRACLDAVKRGASVERLEEMVVHPDAPARGTRRDLAIPTELADSTENTQLDIRLPFLDDGD